MVTPVQPGSAPRGGRPTDAAPAGTSGTSQSAYTLSEREKPAKFAGQKVRVKGVLQAKTDVIDVESIEPVR